MSGRRARRCEVAKRAARVRLVVRLHTICPFENVLVTYSLDYSTPPEFALRFWQMRISARYLEPLQDWVLLRNLLSISLRLGGTMRTMRSEAAENNLLVKSGFIKSERSNLSSKLAIDAPGYSIPVMFNPFYRDGNALINDATFDDESTWPLYRTIVESQSRHLGLTNVGCLKGCERIKFVTGPQARSDLGRLVPVFTRPTEAKWLYMVIEDRGGASQLELANELINVLDRLLYAPILSYTGKPMEEIAIESMWLPCSLWSIVRSHPNHYLLTCENCQRTVLSTNQGPNKRFCSDSCRVSWGRTH